MFTNKKLAILGGGQLGKMLLQKAADYNLYTIVIDPDDQSPCRSLCSRFVHGNFNDYNTVMSACADADIITVEIEHVCIEALEDLEQSGKKVFPQPHILRMVNDKGLQKQFYERYKIPTAEFYLVNNKSEIRTDVFPVIVKARKGGYDGKGVLKLDSAADIQQAFDQPSLVEWCIDFEKEISAVVARNESGQVACFPLVEMYFNSEANLVEMLFSPANVSSDVNDRAVHISCELVKDLNHVGLLAVEMFVTKHGEVLVNEIAPRPHNSGHHTIEANITSQYEQHLRAIFNLPLGSTDMIFPAVMINILGSKGFNGPVRYTGLEEVMAMPGAYIHLYGKKVTKPFRKMGHVTVCNAGLDAALSQAREALQLIKVTT